MTFHDAWITRPEQPPAIFPEGDSAFSAIKDGIQSGRLRGEQAGHLVWRAQMTRGEIEALLEEVFGPKGAYEAQNAGPLEHMAEKMRELRAYVAALPEREEIIVTADEF
jgi:hypothetical protein